MNTIENTTLTSEQLSRINDNIRKNLCLLNCNVRVDGVYGQLVFTRNAIDILGENLAVLLVAIAKFDEFNEGNDPHGEHDFGKIELFGETWFWKFDYYDRKLQYFGHEVHVLTVMNANDY